MKAPPKPKIGWRSGNAGRVKLTLKIASAAPKLLIPAASALFSWPAHNQVFLGCA